MVRETPCFKLKNLCVNKVIEMSKLSPIMLSNVNMFILDNLRQINSSVKMSTIKWTKD
jgi:hypothetical protein